MNIGFSGFARALAGKLSSHRRAEENAEIMIDKPRTGPERVEVEDAITNFKALISRLSGSGTEISELYLSAERKAARYALLSENVIESVSSGIIVVDGQHEICLANCAAKRALGCDESLDLAGRQLKALFEEHKQLETLVSEGFRSRRNSSRKVVAVTLHGGRSQYLGVSTSCVTYGQTEPEAVIIVFTQLDKDAVGMVSGQAGDVSGAAEAYRKGMLDAYGIVSEIYTDIESLRTEMERGQPDAKRLAAAAERVEFACDLMVGFALSKAASGAMTELVDLNGAIKSLLGSKGLSGRRIVVRLAPNLPRVSTLRRVLDAGLDMLLKGCLAESANGVEVVTRMGGPSESPSVALSIIELSPTIPIVEVKKQPQGFLEGKGLSRELGLTLLRSLPDRGHKVAVSREEESFVYSVSFLMPKLSQKEKRSTSGGFTDGESTDGETG
jgi:hypothetical protein